MLDHGLRVDGVNSRCKKGAEEIRHGPSSAEWSPLRREDEADQGIMTYMHFPRLLLLSKVFIFGAPQHQTQVGKARLASGFDNLERTGPRSQTKTFVAADRNPVVISLQ